MAQQKAGGRFSGLRALRAERQESPEVGTELELAPKPEEPATQPEEPPSSSSEIEPQVQLNTPPRRGPGRPPGRRSDPNYTQISAYIPLDLLLAVQDELALERRESRQRTARPVSDLVEELLGEWLKNRKAKISNS